MCIKGGAIKIKKETKYTMCLDIRISPSSSCKTCHESSCIDNQTRRLEKSIIIYIQYYQYTQQYRWNNFLPYLLHLKKPFSWTTLIYKNVASIVFAHRARIECFLNFIEKKKKQKKGLLFLYNQNSKHS